jgi:ABC-type multidrug transport system fused ATPase/permease subunit
MVYVCRWLGALLQLGYKRPLEAEDLGGWSSCPKDELTQRMRDVFAGHVHPSESAGLLADRFEAMLVAGTHQITSARLIRTLCAFEKWSLLFAACNKLTGDLLGFVGPIALSGIVKFASIKSAGGKDATMGGLEMGYWWLIAATVSAFVQNLCLQHHHQLVIRAAIRVKSMLSLLVFRKSLKIDPARRQILGNGKIQNLQSTDAFAVHFTYFFIHYAWSAPLQIAIAMAMLYEQLGPSAFVGLGILLAMIPLQAWLGSLMGHYTKETMQHSDRRIKILSEIIQGIRVIKFFAFEDEMMARVTAARDKEMLNKRHVAVINAINSTF